MDSIRELSKRADLAQLLEEARRQVTQVRELLSSLVQTTRRNILPWPRGRGDTSSVALAQDSLPGDGDQLLYFESSIAKEDFSNGSESSFQKIDITILSPSKGILLAMEEILGLSESQSTYRQRPNINRPRLTGLGQTDRACQAPAPPPTFPHSRPSWKDHPVVSSRI